LGGRVQTGFDSRQGLVVGFCEQSNEPLVP
jgi:hypothetical protein